MKKKEILPAPFPLLPLPNTTLPPGLPLNQPPQSNPLDKFASVWEQEIKRKAKKDDEKNKKGWSKLAEVQKDTILLASMKQDLVKPTKPTDFILRILECDTGIRARELIYAKLGKNIINIDRGFGTTLARGYLVSQPSERDMNDFPPVFTGPDFNLRAQDTEQDHFAEEQATHGKISDETLKMLSQYTAKYPKDYNELRHFTKKISDITNLLFGQDPILALAVRDVYKHISENERSYTQAFIDKWYFGASVVDKIHIRCQKYIRSCTQGEVSEVNVMTLQFGEMFDKIFMSEYVALLPNWVEKTKKRDNEDRSGQGPNKRQNQGNGGTAYNALRDSLKFSFGGTSRAWITPKTKTGSQMCLRFYGTGVCFGNCNKTHTVLDQEEKATWRKYITHCRNNYSKFLEGAKNNDSSENKAKENDTNNEEKNEKKEESGEKKPGKK